MKVPFYCVKDELVGFIPDTFHRGVNDDVEKRNFTVACEDKSTNLNRFPLWYTLWYIGLFDEKDGSFESDPRPLMRASECIFKPKEGDSDEV